MYPIDAVLTSAVAREKLGTGVRFYFGKQSYPTVDRTLGDYVANPKTNAFNKSDQEACEWVFLSALISLHDRAVHEGGDAVVNIRSFYQKREVASETEYECHAGAVLAGVALKGTVVKLVR